MIVILFNIDMTVFFRDCPWTGKTLLNEKKQSDTGSVDTSSFPFSGGWRKDNDIINNEYGGSYNYEPRITGGQTEGYYLDVVPNWDRLTWNACTNNPTISTCKNLDFLESPKNWAGYASDTVSGTTNFIKKEPEGCNNCILNESMLLCTYNDQMLPSSCPGNGMFSLGPSVAPITDYYNDDITKYPRGKGKCYYPINLIQNDNELSSLLTLKDSNRIDPNLADNLAAKYCYQTVTDTTCGEDTDGTPITHCIKYKVDEKANDSATRPCTRWRSSLANIDNTQGRRFLDTYSEQWCNNEENKYTPLCDCIQRDSTSEVYSRPIRNFYDIMTNNYSNVVNKDATITTAIPTQCWYKPCELGSYSIPVIATEMVCPVDANICNQIDFAKDGTISNTQKFLTCSIDKSVAVATAAADVAEVKTSPYLIIIIIVSVIAAVIAVLLQLTATATASAMPTATPTA